MKTAPREEWGTPVDPKALADAVAMLRQFLRAHDGVSARVIAQALDVLEDEGLRIDVKNIGATPQLVDGAIFFARVAP